ncbi:MAG: phosphoribosyl-ATP diphosphatase [Sphingomonadales bacterium]|jgi:phosphoribosyl-ATP pyrophosphohydrolase|nr:phosphoribosyl-ATP diphosphatase [Sphingomonadales bacterium]MBK9004108.1 phosphoribosyl-ATP diphosphatase [Sphingomonadales bacterium]MBK9269284.1 phosphoribosyl-ATP diphosphatase [Sphingomonadales bacterium]MBP6433882.1 phosphoribosyl-ATP diphosphatase [Sphingorhabdus sp.]
MDPRIERLEAVIRARKGGDPASSYVASLFAKGTAKIAQKVGEEATETIIAALKEGPEKLTSEAADLLFHLTILLADAELGLDDVLRELERREGVSGIEEKAGRKG